MTYLFKSSSMKKYSFSIFLTFCLSLGYSTVVQAQKLSADWYGSYKIAMKFGATGTWTDTDEVLVVNATSATIGGEAIQNATYTANGMKWKTAEYSAEINFAAGSNDPVWFEKPESGKLFTGTYTDAASQGKINVKGLKQ